ncbi:uncharacterized protein TNIN_16181 [Trichonephila inaurata madagascariensis]|uniref:Uncharacterized protein n=1 Tax=Trichonephila inaurata madagascariensis TaxID=2747483 RepID=A0A8X6YMJ4_9ARAC|nr:uncharacterized protein TNIN_16181 [Trichonephila inaurata madagascariensis]
MTAKKAVERLDSIKSLHEIELGENHYVKVSTLVECVNETFEAQSSNSENKSDSPVEGNNSNIPLSTTDLKQKRIVDDPEVPEAFRSFLRRFSETNGVEDEFELR